MEDICTPELIIIHSMCVAHLIIEGLVCGVFNFSLTSVVSHSDSDDWTDVRTRKLPTLYDPYSNLPV